jgi:hypothetical protein
MLFAHCFRHLRGFHSRPEIVHPIKNTVYERERIVTIILVYQLESFSSRYACLETNPNVLSLLHRYELLQRSEQQKILKHY